jgi:hypothetical protein
MSYKDASKKQTQDYRDFNHFGAPILLFIMGTSIADPGSRPAFFGAEKWFAWRPPWAVVGGYPRPPRGAPKSLWRRARNNINPAETRPPWPVSMEIGIGCRALRSFSRP